MPGPDTEDLLIRRAFRSVLDSELTYRRTAVTIVGDNGARLSRLKPLWAPRVDREVQSLIQTCTGMVKDKADLICDQAYDVSRSLRVTPGPDGYARLMAAEEFAESPEGGRLQQCISGSAIYQAAHQAAAARLVEILDNCDELDAFLQTKAVEQQRAFEACTGTISRLRVRINGLTSERVFGIHLRPLAVHCTSLLDEIASKVEFCTGAEYIRRTEKIAFSFDGPDDHILITTCNWALHQLCDSATRDCGELAELIAPEVFSGLRQVVGTQRLIDNFGLFLTDLGGPAFEALVELGETGRREFLARWRELQSEFVKKCPPGSSSSEILAYCLIAGSGGSVLDSIIAVIGGNLPRVVLPPGVRSQGWRVVNGSRIPAAFTKDGLSTDQACLKHCDLELGLDPPIGKMTAYFAELVAACEQAGAAWTANGGPDLFAVTVRVGGTDWRVIVGSKGRKIVHHLDSGLRESPWAEV